VSGSRRVWIVALTGVGLVFAGEPIGPVQATMPRCAPVVRAVARFPERIDSLVAVGSSGAVVALAGPRSSTARYLPHDNLTLLTRHGVASWRFDLPRYITPPGLVVSGSVPTTVSVVVDHSILSIDPRSGALRGRSTLDMQALGWPAAAVGGAGGRLFVAGQPDSGWEAVVEALAVGPAGRAHVAWRTQLGLFHAGIWLAPAHQGQLVVYLPGAYDAPGVMALLDERRGALHPAYHVAGPPVAADATRDRLYRVDASTVYALDLDNGRTVASVPGTAPLALDPSRGLIAYVGRDGLVLASARTLRTTGRVALNGVTALTFTPDGATLVAGLRAGLAWIDVQGCQAES